MGRRDRLKSNPVIHRSKLFGGVKTAQEVHAQLGMRTRCLKCGGPPAIKVKMFMLHDEFVKRDPMLAASIAKSNPGGPYIPTTKTTFGPMVLFSTATACRIHQKELELVAAKAPSYVLVEIDRGPGADKPIVQVAR
jgi:hypothetical protein